MPLTPDEKHIITFEGFKSLYNSLLSYEVCGEEAYIMAEERVRELIGMTLYPSYSAFRKDKYRRRNAEKAHLNKSERLSKYLKSK